MIETGTISTGVRIATEIPTESENENESGTATERRIEIERKIIMIKRRVKEIARIVEKMATCNIPLEEVWM